MHSLFPSISDTEMAFVDEHRAIVLAAAPSMGRRVLVPNTTYADLGPSAFAVSPDRKFVFLAHDSFKVGAQKMSLGISSFFTASTWGIHI